MTQKRRLLRSRFNKIKGRHRSQFKYRFEQEVARRAEAMLAESQRISRLGSWDWDLATDKVQFSDEMFRLIGMMPEQGELSREVFLKFLHPDETEQILYEFQKGLPNGNIGIEHQVILPDGEIRTMRTRIKTYKDENGTPLRLLGSTQDITDQKILENNLRESEWRNRLISELTTDYIFVADVDPDGSLKLSWASENMLRMTGRALEELGMSGLWGGIIHPEDRSAFFDFISQVLSKAYVGSFECRTFHKDGHERWIRIFARPEVGKENKIITVVGAVKDISENKRAEKALLESEQKYRFLVENIRDVIWQASPDFRFTYISHAGKFYGDYQVEEILGKSVFDFMTPQSKARVMKSIDMRQKFFQRGERVGDAIFEVEYVLKNGMTIWTEVNSNPVYDDSGHLIYFQGTARDITRRKQMESLLRESELRNRLISELTTDYVFVLDVTANGSLKYRWVSDNIFRMTGLTTEDLSDTDSWGNFFHPEDRDAFFGFLGRVLSMAHMGSIECRTFHKDGHARWVRIFARPEVSAENKIIAIVGAVKDIAESKKAEKALLEANSNLEAKVEERTRELLASRNQLRELTRQIVSAQENERHRISRELHDEAGQSLVGLRFSLDSIYREIPTGYPKIRKRMEQSLSMVDQTLSRLRTLAYELRPPMLDLMGIYLSIKQLCQDFSEQTGIKVEFSGCVLDDLEDEISISLYRFVQEALTNAAKHGCATNIQVVLNYANGIIAASVRDDGRGISETWKPGLGLTGIKERFDFLGGQLEIGPSTPKGTLIQIRLPWNDGVSLP